MIICDICNSKNDVEVKELHLTDTGKKDIFTPIKVDICNSCIENIRMTNKDLGIKAVKSLISKRTKHPELSKEENGENS